MSLTLRLAWRELRGGVRGWWLALACLILGVAAMAAVGELRAAVAAGLAQDGRRILGGDLEIDAGAEGMPGAVGDWLLARGARLSAVVRLRSLLVAPSGARALVEVKAVDAAWPLVGAAGLAPPQTLAAGLARRDGRYGLLAEPVVLDRLGLRIGARVRLGEAEFELRGALTREPDRVGSSGIFGPHVLIAAAALPATGLLQPGSLDDHALRAVVPASSDVAALAGRLKARFAPLGLRVHEVGDAAPGLQRFVDRTALFLGLVGLTTLLMGGIGVANGVRAWLERRARSLAILRCLGASDRLIFSLVASEIALLAAFGIGLGLGVGAILPALLGGPLAGVLPLPLRPGVYPGALALAALYGTLTAAAFALWPLARGTRIAGAALFRDTLLPAPVRPGAGLLAVIVALGLGLVALTLAAAPDRRLALWFCIVVAGAYVLLRLVATGLMRLARGLEKRTIAPWARLGLANLHRGGSTTPLMLLSLGLGFSTLSTVALIEANLRRQVAEELPARAPSLYFIDIQRNELDRFNALLRAAPEVAEVAEVPNLRARIVAVAGVPAEQVKASPESAWALRGDRGLTYAASPPPGTRLVAGTWWATDYNGPPLVSLDAGMAHGWGVGVGDVLRVNVLGRTLDLRIASLRAIDWSSLGINFIMVASPGLLSQAPHGYIAALRVATGEEGRLLRAVTDALPNVTGIPLAEVLRAIAALLGEVSAALMAAGGLTLIAGAMVLAGAVAAGQHRRRREAVILRTLGATRAQLVAAWLTEFATIGLAAGLIAALTGAVASYGVIRLIQGGDWQFAPIPLLAPLFGALALILVIGAGGLAATLRARPAALLRNE